MSKKYLVNESEFIEVADAIRESCDFTNELIWPNGFKDAILSSIVKSNVNLSVVKGDTYPENPVENTLLVNTNVDISKWILSDMLPSDTTEGCLWIQTGDCGSPAINVVFDNSIILHFTKTKQYINGSWVNVDSYMYSNGEWTKSHSFPSAYQKVEYLQASGTQYIDTGYVQTANTEYDITYEWLQHEEFDYIFAANEFHGDVYKYGIIYRDGITRYNLSNGNQASKYEANHSIGTKVTASFHNGILTVDNVQTHVGPVTNLSLCNLCLFAGQSRYTNYDTYQPYIAIDGMSSARIYEFKISELGKLILHMVPCYRRSDNVAGMYDLVNDKFYVNGGSGTFLVGEDVNE